MLHHSSETGSNQTEIGPGDQADQLSFNSTGEIEPMIKVTRLIDENMRQGISANAVKQLIAFFLRES